MTRGDGATSVTSEVTLLLDVGSAFTKGILVGRAVGRWRIVAAVSQPTVWGDASLRRAIAARLAGGADRRLIDRLEQLVADAPVIECHTPRRPGRLALAAVSGEISAPTARLAAESAGWVVVEEASVDDGRPLGDRLGALQAAVVDAWVLAGGFDGAAAEQALEMAALVAAARSRAGGPVIWAGSARLADSVTAMFEPGAVTAIGNPRPSPEASDPGPLRRHLERLLQRLVEPRVTIHTAPVAFRRALAELSRSAGLRVLGVDVGAQYTSFARADAEGRATSRVFATGGLGDPGLTELDSPARLARGLPNALDELVVADALRNVHARPATLPETEDELAIVQGAARQQLARLAAIDPAMVEPVDLIVGSGRTIGAAPHPGQAFQILLDGLRPLGVTQFALDAAGSLAPLGALEDDEIAEGVGALRDDLLVPLGAAVVGRGGRPGQVAMRVTLRRSGRPPGGPYEVRTGRLAVVPLPRGAHAELEIELGEHVSLGGAERARQINALVTGGAVGLVLDARGQPVGLPRRLEDRRAVLATWRAALMREATIDEALAGGGSSAVSHGGGG